MLPEHVGGSKHPTSDETLDVLTQPCEGPHDAHGLLLPEELPPLELPPLELLLDELLLEPPLEPHEPAASQVFAATMHARAAGARDAHCCSQLGGAALHARCRAAHTSAQLVEASPPLPLPDEVDSPPALEVPPHAARTRTKAEAKNRVLNMAPLSTRTFLIVQQRREKSGAQR